MKYIIILFVFTLLVSCGKNKALTKTEEKSTIDYSLDNAISTYSERVIDYDTFSAQIKCRFEDKDKSLSFKTTVKIKKDEMIWVSAGVFGFEGVRALITPDSVKVINRIEKEYYIESIDELQNISGLPVDFLMLQQLATGKMLLIDAEESSITQKDGIYEIIAQLDNISTLTWLDDANFEMKQQNMIAHSENNQMEISYHNYKNIGAYHFPFENNVSVTGKRELWLDLEYTEIEIDQDENFSFSIPRGYKRTKL